MLTVSASYRSTEEKVSGAKKEKGQCPCKLRPGDRAFEVGLQKSWSLEVRLLLTQK